MCLNNVYENVFCRFLQYFAALLLTAQTIDQRGYITNKKTSKKLAMLLAHYFIRKPVKNLLITFVRNLNKKQTKRVGHFFGKASFSKTCFPVEWLGKPRYVPFENVMLSIPSEAEKYLALRFGNYMEMPDEKTLKEYPVHALFVDLENDYSLYL
jgi:lipopolysaccharide cholinephosphotransferase